MKKKYWSLVFVTSLLLCGCDFLDRIFHKDPNGNNQEITGNFGNFYGKLVNGEKYNGFELSKNKNEIKKPTKGTGSINIIAFNDFHGAVNETDSEAGLKRLATYFKTESSNENTLIFDQGDTWQGSLESNHDYGYIVQKAFYKSGVALRTIGNHDFDWGTERLKALCETTNNDFYVPTLGANIYNYKDGKMGNEQQEQFGKDYAIFTVENGLKIGVVGVIGDSELTSISSQLVSDIAFSNQNEKIKEVSDFLRVEKQCDVVIASIHDYASNNLGYGLTEISKVSGKRYVDLVLNGHSHSRSKEVENGVVFAQWDANGKTLGKISLKYDFALDKIVDSDTRVNSYNANYLRAHYSTIDSEIEIMVDEYLESIQSIGNEVLSSNFVNSWSEETLGNLMSEAIFNSAVSNGEEIGFAVCNLPRAPFEKSEMLYTDLYKCFPFDNQIVLMDITGSTAVGSILSCCSYRENTSLRLSPTNTYRIAIIDYIGLHQNVRREYDYFPEASNIKILKNGAGEPLYYRDILADYLRNNKTKTFDSSNYTISDMHFSVN